MSTNWEYYKKMAYECNALTDEKGEKVVFTEDDKEFYAQNPFSFYEPFYKTTSENELNTITRAFLNPDTASFPEYEEETSVDEIKSLFGSFPEEKKPNDNQYDAIYHAMNEPVSIIQGPPGTGKTETIINIIRTIHQKFKYGKTIAVVSNNREALNNIHDAIEASSLPVDKEIAGKFARLGNASVRNNWQKQHEELADYFYSNNFKPSFLKEVCPFFSSTLHSLKRIFTESDINFDYVIIDESSQTNITLGLIAMSSAKHLVVLGDTKQLSAIITKNMESITEDFEQEKKIELDRNYRERDEHNFLAACEKVFGNKITSTMLTKHYRCHHSIIDFCNEYVYNGKLDYKHLITEENKDEFRIRAVWYEGSYHTRLKNPNLDSDEDNNNNDIKNSSIFGNYNLRQIRIFLEEELPRYLRMVEEKKQNLSFGVIAPFRAQLNILHYILKIIKNKCMDRPYDFVYSERNKAEKQNLQLVNEIFSPIMTDELVKTLKDLNFHTIFSENTDEECEDINEEGTEPDTDYSFPCFTIHKSQGKGYDIVYFLTTADKTSSSSEWAQRMRMMNVAVSRAKKEFCIITPSCWMPKEAQENFGITPGFISGIKMKKAKEKDNNGYFFQKLLQYVYDKCPAPQGDYGFHKSQLAPNDKIDRIGQNYFMSRASEVKQLITQRDDFLKAQLEKLSSAAKNDLQIYFPNFSIPKNVNYDNPVTRAAYHCKYTMAYSFEYAMLWEIILRSYIENPDNSHIFSVVSVGCGAMTEAWSLAYAKTKLAEIHKGKYQDLKISFTGIDINSWEERFMEDADGFEFSDNPATNKKAQAIILPKLLNHTGAKCVEKILDNYLDKNAEEWYLCISHSKKSVDNKVVSLEEIDSILERNYKVTDLGGTDSTIKNHIENDRKGSQNKPIAKMPPALVKGKPMKGSGRSVTGPNKIPYYLFKEGKISSISEDFKSIDDIRKILEIIDNDNTINPKKDLYANCILNTNHFAFQVVKLTKKQ